MRAADLRRSPGADQVWTRRQCPKVEIEGTDFPTLGPAADLEPTRAVRAELEPQTVDVRRDDQQPIGGPATPRERLSAGKQQFDVDCQLRGWCGRRLHGCRCRRGQTLVLGRVDQDQLVDVLAGAHLLIDVGPLVGRKLDERCSRKRRVPEESVADARLARRLLPRQRDTV